jgi:hypothetical protein
LKYFAIQPKLSSKQVKWQDTLALFNVDIRHKPGKDNMVLDVLSWKHQFKCTITLFKKTYYWPNLKNDAKEYVKTCLIC